MTLPRDYRGQTCALSRSMEIVGERWTLLILRDAFYGVRRFGEFAAHLAVPRAVLTDRLATLVEAGVLDRRPEPGTGRREVYVLTPKGIALWPAVRALTAWGEEFYAAEGGPRRVFRHVGDEAPIDAGGRCTGCGTAVPVEDILVTPGPGLGPPAEVSGTESDAESDEIAHKGSGEVSDAVSGGASDAVSDKGSAKVSGRLPGKGSTAPSAEVVDPVTAALTRPHRLLTPLISRSRPTHPAHPITAPSGRPTRGPQR
ncbi:helix-turn-helix domain-containing protein [Streptomyces sp. NPDC042898]|uniref:winged helix-turn-helix transcriptional regulator n=1 Tax=Streptomyces sp. NPDC042898 TaxID=3154334 RepID=UPI0033D813FA